VSDLSKNLVKTWKAQVERQRRDSTKGAKPAASTGSAAADGAAKPAAEDRAPPAKVNIDFEVLNDKTRNACLKLLYSSLELQKGADPQLIFTRVMEIEQATLEKQGGGTVNGEYRSKVRSLSLNLKDKNNPELRQQVLDGDVPAATLVTMRPEELASSARKAERESIQQQNLHNAKGAEAQEAETDAFQCGKCKQRRTRYYQMQTRSADEPMYVLWIVCA